MANARIPELHEAGAARVVCLVKEDLAGEVPKFQEYWTGDVFLDPDLAFYRALGGGELWNSTVGLVLAGLRAPLTSARANTARFGKVVSSGAAMNVRGEGIMAGGCFVLRPDGEVAYSFLEQVLGESPPLDEVLEAVRAAAVARRGA
uniref:Peroxiredoxin-like 2A n=1 Tax=Alexandrium monilatum TaxID=311494 RepID=A0A7S4VJ28_9DINO|mmetsp:Transcript_18984/g.57127  ORF Transcript_18984/g.57127 Transcript_18984/m.57127 type:complete len:147 (-) Transcript_18984:61-501(-)